MREHSTDMVLMQGKAPRLNKTAQVQAIARSAAAGAGYVPHLGLNEVIAVADAAGRKGRHRERDRLLVQTLFDGCLRVSEALRLKPKDVKRDSNGWRLDVFGKGNRPGVAAISPSLAAQMQAYAYRHGLGSADRFFPVSRTRAFQIVQRASRLAGVAKPDHVGTCHVLRHSGAIERLRATGNPKAVQDQLRHSTVMMTMRYFKTLAAEESLKVQQEVDFSW